MPLFSFCLTIASLCLFIAFSKAVKIHKTRCSVVLYCWSMHSATINGVSVFVTSRTSVLEACNMVGVNLPRFCYHPKLSVAGNCRMCLVEVEKSPKPVVGCAMPVAPNMQIFTNTPLVYKAREGVLEALLFNHPLDCPICDQGGECDLQDQSLLFGVDASRYFAFSKRPVEDKYCGPIIKTVMTRCIHCTRCVRYFSEVAGVAALGTLNRGGSTEIGSYVNTFFSSEVSGNVIDLCPVGALTSKLYSLRARPWDLVPVEGVDPLDSIGSSLYYDLSGSEVFRVVPRLNEPVNSEWISDRVRFSYDAIHSQRIKNYFLQRGVYSFSTSKLPSCYNSVFSKFQSFFSLIYYDYNVSTSLFLFDSNIISPRDLVNLSFLKNFDSNVRIRNAASTAYTLDDSLLSSHTAIADLKKSDLCVILNVNPRIEAAVLNIKLRERHNLGGFSSFFLGGYYFSNFPLKSVALSVNTLLDLLYGNSLLFKKCFSVKKQSFLVYGSSINRLRLSSFVSSFLAKNLQTYSLYVPESLGQVAEVYQNVKRISLSDVFWGECTFLLSVEDSSFLCKALSESYSKNCYSFHSHGSRLMSESSAGIAPLKLAAVEKNTLLFNLEGRGQSFSAVCSPFSLVYGIREICIVLYFFCFGLKLPLASKIFNYSFLDLIHFSSFKREKVFMQSLDACFVKPCKIYLSSILKPSMTDFYLSSFFTKNSKFMGKCSGEYRELSNNFL